MNLSGKKVAVLGLGMEGLDLCEFLLKKGALINVFDQKEPGELRDSYLRLKKAGVKFVLGRDYLKKGLKDFEIVFRSPGFKPSLPAILNARKAGVKISSATKLFFDLCPGKIIGVTGTKGKGTTATLIYKILKEAKKDVFLAGNIGQPMLALLPKLNKKAWVVLELSSFQLMDLKKSPFLAVVLFVASEHLDYHQDTKEYVAAKANLMRYQTKEDLAVLNADDPTSSSFAKLTKAEVFWFSRKKAVKGAFVRRGKIYLNQSLVGETKNLKIPGQHNWENVTAAIAAASLAGAELDFIKKVVFAFKGLEHRLEKVREIGGVSYYNDSFSTTPETTIAAIRSFSRPLVLIAGGSEKGSDFSLLGKKVADSSVKTLILIGKTATKIKKACRAADFKGKIIFRPRPFKKAVKLAAGEARVGEVVLLSPACASFDMFANYKQRGKLFKKYVQAL